VPSATQMTEPEGAATTAAARVLCGRCAVPSAPPPAAASTNTVQRGIVVVRATVTARGALPGGSGAPGASVVAGVAGAAMGTPFAAGAGEELVAGAPVIAGLGDPLDGNGWPLDRSTPAAMVPMRMRVEIATRRMKGWAAVTAGPGFGTAAMGRPTSQFLDREFSEGCLRPCILLYARPRGLILVPRTMRLTDGILAALFTAPRWVRGRPAPRARHRCGPKARRERAPRVRGRARAPSA
jgi:hypothetical protein